jgi:5-methylcytosine-specific restriction endonuclease McrA
MGRPFKGEPLKGAYKPCRYCGVVIYRSPSQAKQKTFFHMKCLVGSAFNFPCYVCKKPVYTQPAQVKQRCRSTCSLLCRRKLSRQRAEERRKKLGYTKHQLDRLARYSPEADKWRKKVFERDNWTCQFCGVRGGRLEADHIKPWAYFEELRFSVTNGRTLCRPCHDTTKMSAQKMKEVYGKS